MGWITIKKQAMSIHEIEKKYDSQERLQKVAGKPHNTLLFAPEFNAVVDNLKLKGQYKNNDEAKAFGLEHGDFYNLPEDDAGNYKIAVVKLPGLVQLIDKNQEVFNSLETAEAYVYKYTDAILESVSYENGVYTFLASYNATIYEPEFCASPAGENLPNAQNLQFLDPLGMFVLFAENCFAGNSQNNIFGNGVLFDQSCFENSTGNNTLGYSKLSANCFKNSTGNNALKGIAVKGGDVFFGASGNNTIDNVFVLDGGGFFCQTSGNNIFKKYENKIGGSFISASGTNIFESVTAKGKSHFQDSSGIFYFKGKCYTTDPTFFLDTTGTIHAKPLSIINQQALGYAVANGATLLQDL